MALVMVVDDEVGIARLLEDVLTDEGYEVVLATNGRQALERAAARRPDLVITDFMMPVMDGAALIRAMAADPRLNDIPVVVMSSVPEEVIAERASGYALFVHKPFKIFPFLHLMRPLLAGRGAGRGPSAPRS
jgi:CheY-like chemotaxis protein